MTERAAGCVGAEEEASELGGFTISYSPLSALSAPAGAIDRKA